jgi:hypothetical protein
MARELVTEQGVGESADIVWRQIQAQQDKALAAKPVVESAPAPVSESMAPQPPVVTPVVNVPALARVLKFGVRQAAAQPARHREKPEPSQEQFSLF